MDNLWREDRKKTVLRLSEEDFKRFVAAIKDDAAPNSALAQAADRYKERIKSGAITR